MNSNTSTNNGVTNNADGASWQAMGKGKKASGASASKVAGTRRPVTTPTRPATRSKA